MYKIIPGILLMSLCSCVSLLPVNNHYEKAGTLQKGNIELSGHITRYDVSHFERTELSNINYGFRAGYGISDRFDVKLRYERMDFASNFDHKLSIANHYALTTKYGIVPGYFSALLTFGSYSATQHAYGDVYRMQVRSISPQFIFSITNRKKTVDLSWSAKADFLYEVKTGSDNNMFLNATMGAGFSKDLRKWAVRPEIGISASDSQEKFICYGIGLQWIIPTKRK